MDIPIYSKAKLLIFDCDGTMFDTDIVHKFAWDFVLNKYKIPKPDHGLSKLNGISTKNILKILDKNLTEKEIQQIAKDKEQLATKRIYMAKPIKPIINIINKYHQKIPLIVFSGSIKEHVNWLLEQHHLQDKFELIITASDNFLPKSDPQAFIELAQKFKVKPEECVFFEDGILGLQAAILAGVKVIDARNIL